jgi:hypothetical protein
MINPTDYIVKITLYKGYYADAVVYYNYAIPHVVFSKYEWYFDYLAALVKVRFPHEKVELLKSQQGTKPFLAGKDYIEKKSQSLLKAKRSQLKQLETKGFDDDLFSFKGQEIEEKKDRIRKEIEDLENGKFNYWFPPTYINRIKELCK